MGNCHPEKTNVCHPEKTNDDRVETEVDIGFRGVTILNVTLSFSSDLSQIEHLLDKLGRVVRRRPGLVTSLLFSLDIVCN